MQDKKTPLYDFHLNNQAKMVSFAGWSMPIQYLAGIKSEHLSCRQSAALFDVSHMAQVTLRGADVDRMLAQLTPTNMSLIKPGSMRYSLFLNPNGGVRDDLMITRLEDEVRLVVNASRAAHDIDLLKTHLNAQTTMHVRDDLALLALQGPQAANVMTRLGADIQSLGFMKAKWQKASGISLLIMRSGYSGEDGFEISVHAEDAMALAEQLAADDDVTLAGLGARDTLRLEAGLPLWGQELDESINPIEAGLGFAISKERRLTADFPGAEVILKDLAKGPKRQLVGLLPEGQRPVRQKAVLIADDQQIGQITSGGYSPSLSCPIAIGLVAHGYHEIGTKIIAREGGRETLVDVSPLPFMPHRYHRLTSTISTPKL